MVEANLAQPEPNVNGSCRDFSANVGNSLKTNQRFPIDRAKSGTMFGMPKPAEGVGAVIRRLREDARLSQAELERKAGLSASSISDYETGKHAPSAKSLRAIRDALEVPPHLWAAEIEAASSRGADEVRERAYERGQDEPFDDWTNIFTVNGIRPENVLALIGIAIQEGRANEPAMRQSACLAAEKIVSAQFALARIGAAGLKNNGDDDGNRDQ